MSQFGLPRLPRTGPWYCSGRLWKILNVPCIHKSGFYASVRQRIGKEIVRPAIYGGRRNDVVPGPGDVLDGIRDSGSPGGDGQRGRPSFQGGDAFFKNICGRVHQAVINIARLRQGKTACRLFRVFEDIRSGGVNRHGARIGGRIRTFLTHMDLACFKSMVLTHGFYIPIGKLGNK